MTANDFELPPLPSPFGIVDPMGSGEKIYTLKDMGDYARAYARATIEADRKRRFESGEALQRYKECEGDKESDPIERLRFFCSLAMSGQDWLDSEQFFEDLIADRQRRGEPVAWRVHPFDYGVGYEGVYALTSRPDQVAAWERKGWEVQPLFTAPQPAESCASLMSDKTACGSENGDCDSQPAEPVKVPSDKELYDMAESMGAVIVCSGTGDYNDNVESVVTFARALLARYCKGTP